MTANTCGGCRQNTRTMRDKSRDANGDPVAPPETRTFTMDMIGVSNEREALTNIRPNDFLRTRTKKGGRVYLVKEVRVVRRRVPAVDVRLRITCYRSTVEQWEQREEEQVTTWFKFYSRKDDKRPDRAPGTDVPQLG